MKENSKLKPTVNLERDELRYFFMSSKISCALKTTVPSMISIWNINDLYKKKLSHDESDIYQESSSIQQREDIPLLLREEIP